MTDDVDMQAIHYFSDNSVKKKPVRIKTNICPPRLRNVTRLHICTASPCDSATRSLNRDYIVSPTPKVDVFENSRLLCRVRTWISDKQCHSSKTCAVPTYSGEYGILETTLRKMTFLGFLAHNIYIYMWGDVVVSGSFWIKDFFHGHSQWRI